MMRKTEMSARARMDFTLSNLIGAEVHLRELVTEAAAGMI
jgi:hypothetical protein